MNTVADDLQEPDETRPAKRVRLEAPLEMTEEVEEEMIDDEDLYGTDGDGEADARAVIEEPHLPQPQGEDAAHELPHSIAMAADGVQAQVSGSATPKVDGEGTDTEDLYGEDDTETVDGLPVEAVDHGEDEFVAPPTHMQGEDGVQEAMMEEMSHVGANPPVDSTTHINGEQETSISVTEQKMEVDPPQQNFVAPEDAAAEHIAPPRLRPTDEEQAGGAAKSAKDGEDEEDVLGGLESALRAGSADDAPTNEQGPSSTTKPKEDPEFLAAAAAQKRSGSAEWQFDSSDAESSSSDSSDSSDSDGDSGSGSEDGYKLLDPETQAKILMSGDADDDDGKEKGSGGGGPRTANEVKDEIVPKPDVKVTEDMKITLLGTVGQVVENMALITGATPGEFQVLEPGSVLCNASREVIGVVSDTFGQVQHPMYSVAFTNAKEIEDLGLQFGTQVYYVDVHSKFVFTQPLKGMKGTDASNIHDEEVDENEIEFSDDEEEAKFKRERKAAKRGGRGALTRTDFKSDRGALRTFGAPGHDSGHTFIPSGAADAPQTSYGGGMSYDEGDAEDGFYQPLKRPDNLSELMSGAPPPPPSQRGGFDRGRGRGRGRGDRGRGDRGRGRGGFNQRGNHHNGSASGSPPRGGHGQNGQRGGRDQANGHRGAAHSFPDRHNNQPKNRGRGGHNLPAKPQSQQSPTPPQSSPQQQQHQQPTYPPYNRNHPQIQQPPIPPSPQQQQSYQFNGYTFQYGTAPPQPPQPSQSQPPLQPPQNFYQNYQSYQQNAPSPPQQHSPTTPQIPPGAYVNPQFWAQQQQAASQQYGGGWGAQAPQGQPQYGGWSAQAQGQVQGQGQQNQLADILRTLQQGQGQR